MQIAPRFLEKRALKFSKNNVFSLDVLRINARHFIESGPEMTVFEFSD